MRKHLLLGSALVLLAAGPALADIDRVNDVRDLTNATQRYRVTYTDGGKENYVAEYSAHLERHMWEGGEPSTLLHPVDTRHCDWQFRSYITRKVYYPNRAGVRFELPGLAKPFQRDASGRGGGFVLLQGHAQTCNDAASSFDQESSSYAADVNAALATVMTSDADAVKRDIGVAIQSVRSVEPL